MDKSNTNSVNSQKNTVCKKMHVLPTVNKSTQIKSSITPVNRSFSRSSVHTHVTSVATKPEDPTTDKYKTLTARKFFTCVLAAKLSAYEAIRMEQGLPVGGWVTSSSHDVLKAIKANKKYFIKDIHHKDGRKEKIVCKTSKYGYLDENGIPVIHEHQKRWIRLFHCGSQMVEFEKDGETYFASKQHDCGDKICMRCARKKGYRDFVKHKDVIFKELNEPVMLVLHQRNPKSGKLGEAIDKMYKDFRLNAQQNSKDAKKGKCKKWSYYWSFEITVNVKDLSFHPHMHLLCEKSQAEEILTSWIDRDPEERTLKAHSGAIGDVLTNESELIECFKYVTKIATDEIDKNGKPKKKKKTITNKDGTKGTVFVQQKSLTPIPLLYEMLMALYGRRRNSAVGNIYNHRLTNEKSKEQIANEVRQIEKKEGFNVDDNPIITLCEIWQFDYHRTNYFGVCEGAEINLAKYEPTKETKRFLKIGNEDAPELHRDTESYKEEAGHRQKINEARKGIDKSKLFDEIESSKIDDVFGTMDTKSKNQLNFKHKK